MKRLLFISMLLLPSAVLAGQLDSKFDSIAAQFARDAAARSLDLAAAPAAVFPYGCDEKLAKKRVDVAVGELFTARLLRGGSFKLVERSQLDQVMKEQALGLSGALDSATAAQVGKLAGARLAILGTVTRVGKAYQISSKLVDAESAEIISASIVEVPLETFDEEAARYLVLVPEREALGLYMGFLFAPVKTKSLPTTIVSGKVVTPKPESTALWGISVGLRYQVAKRWVADLAVFPALTLGTAAKFSYEGQVYSPPAGTLDGMGARLSVNRTASLSRKWRGIYGLGYQIYDFQAYDDGVQQMQIGSTYLDKPTGGSTVYGAFARGGLEFRPKERFAISVFGQLNQPADLSVEWTRRDTGAKVKIMELDMPVFSLDSAFTFYF
jgi:TolB-like protein